MTWALGQEVVRGELLRGGEVREMGRGLVERVYQDGGCKALGQRWRRDGCMHGARAWSSGAPLRTAADWETKARRHVEVAQEHAARVAEAKRRTEATDRIVAALRDASVKQVEALASEIEARSPTFGSIVYWQVYAEAGDTTRHDIEAEARTAYAAAVRASEAEHREESARLAEDGEPAPYPLRCVLAAVVVVESFGGAP